MGDKLNFIDVEDVYNYRTFQQLSISGKPHPTTHSNFSFTKNCRRRPWDVPRQPRLIRTVYLMGGRGRTVVGMAEWSI